MKTFRIRVDREFSVSFSLSNDVIENNILESLVVLPDFTQLEPVIVNVIPGDRKIYSSFPGTYLLIIKFNDMKSRQDCRFRF